MSDVSKKLYLESDWTSESQLYQFYSENCCSEKNLIPLSSCTSYKTFDDLNLSLYRSQKDQCDVYTAYKLQHISEEECDIHLGK